MVTKSTSWLVQNVEQLQGEADPVFARVRRSVRVHQLETCLAESDEEQPGKPQARQ